MLRVLQWEKDMGAMERIGGLLRRILRPALLLSAMFLLMRAELFMRASPLAPALLAAGLAAGESVGALVAGCLLGMLRLPLSEISLLPAVSCVLVLAAELLFAFLPLARKWSAESRVSMVSGLAVLLPAMLFANADPADSARALACALLSAASAPFLLPVLALQPERKHLAVDEKTGALLLVCGCLAGIQSFFPPAAEAIAVLLILLLPTWGTFSGVAAGIALCLGGANLLKIAALSLCAAASGMKICTLRWQRALAVCGAAAAMHATSGAAALGIPWVLCAAALYMLLPESVVSAVKDLAAPEQDFNPERIAREITLDKQRRLRALGDAFSLMAESCASPTDVPDEQELICEMRSRLCTGCTGYEACWAGESNQSVRLLCALIAESLTLVDAPQGMRVLFSDGDIPPDIMRICRRGRMIPDRLGLLLRDFAQKRRSEIKRCMNGQLMSVQFTQAREILYDLAGENRGGFLSSARREQLQSALAGEGILGCEVMNLGLEPLELRLLRPGREWTADEIRRAGRVLGRCLGRRLLPLLRGEALHLVCMPRLAADTGSSCRSGVAGEVCGDSHLVRMLDGNRLLLALSDGMGSGEAAADESIEALRLTWHFLDAGISRRLALETVNRQLLGRSGSDMFATMDLCIIDLNTGIAEITKLAACRTLVLRNGQILRIEGGNLPLGILEDVQPSLHRVRLKPGDMLVMGSDGVMEAGDPLLMERLIRENGNCAPRQLTELLVREADMRREGSRRDDMTCICMRVEDAKNAG